MGRNTATIAAVASSLAVLALAACGHSDDGSGDEVASRDTSKRYDETDPATWALPVEAYLPTDAEEKQLSRARDALVSPCMKRFGLDWSAAPDLPELGPKSLTDWRYGIHDGELAKRRGYKPDAGEQTRYDEAMRAGAVNEDESPAETQILNGDVFEYAGQKVPEGGCSGEADRKISGGAESYYSEFAEDLGNDAFLRAKKQPEVVKVFRLWSTCMKESGYSYAEPLDASDDPRFGSPDVTAEEIATASADIRCRDRHHVARTWFEAEVRLQKKEMEKHAEELDAAQKRLDASLKRASKLVAEDR